VTKARPLATGGASIALAVLAVVLIGATLRPALTAVGPLLHPIGTDLGLAPVALGLLTSIPLLAFATVSPLVPLLTRRWGMDRTVLVATVVLTAAIVLRSLPGGQLTLWAGTALTGAAIAVGNVCVPALLKRDFPHEVPRMTAVYSTALGGTAALASGLAVPVADRYGWRVALGGWALLSLVTAVVLVSRRHGAPAVPRVVVPPTGDRTLWTSAVAWQVTGFMATQACTFYLLVTWLPTILVERGVDPVTSGWTLFLYQIVGLPAGLVAGAIMRGRADHRVLGVGVSAALALAVGGLLLVPAWTPGWVVLAGCSGGSSLVVALALIGERTRHAGDAARLSGMVQSVGYLLAIVGPLGAGWAVQLSSSWTPALVGVIVVAGIQLVLSLLVGRDRKVGPRPTAEVSAR
jgi:CP family cyanate transporter-like MFS transporter